jgi:hypothetical protein
MIVGYFTERPYRWVPEDEVLKNEGFFAVSNKLVDREKAALPVEPNSTIYWFATHPSDPDVIVANSLNGYVYTSTDGGDSWQKVTQEFGEIRAVAWVPN